MSDKRKKIVLTINLKLEITQKVKSDSSKTQMSSIWQRGNNSSEHLKTKG